MVGFAEPAVVIGNSVRTAIGAFNATLKGTPATDLGELVVGERGAQSRETPRIDPAALPGLGKVRLRQLRRPEDEAAFRRFGAALAPEDLRTRFAVPTRWSPAVAERLWALDGVAFAAFDEGGEILGMGEVVGTEVGLAIRSDLKRHGLGRALLERIVRHAFEEGATELTATVLAENFAMLDLARRIGFRETGLAGTEVSMRLCLP
jgi:RimJ/RimL family protein N-acetyltransferase